MRLVKGEDRCIYCGYKLSSKLRRELAEEPSTIEGVSAKSSKAIRDFEDNERRLDLEEKKAFRRKLIKYAILISSGLWLFWIFTVLYSIFN